MMQFLPIAVGPGALVRLKSNVAARQLPLSPMVSKRHLCVSAMEIVPLRIAILDDDRSVRLAISRLLKACHLETETFANCKELLNFLKRDVLDCLVLDLQMPGMNGIDVMRHLGQRGVVLPVVIMTAHDGPGTRETCLSAGALGYVRKPLDVETLLHAIREAMTASRPTL